MLCEESTMWRLWPLALKIALECGKTGGSYPICMNAANEEAVFAFLEGKIKFLQIADLVEKALLSVNNKNEFNLEDILETDKLARECVINNS